MIREVLKIRTDNGFGDKNPSFHDIELTEYHYKCTRMGVPELTATLMWSKCLDEEWSTKEYVVLRGERFYIRHTPTSEKNNSDTRYKHSINFTSEYAEILGHTYFVDAVPSYSTTYDKPCTNNTKFTFYGTVFEFADRLNCALLYAGVGDSILKTKTLLNINDTIVGDGFCVIVDTDGINDPDKTYDFSFEDQKIWDALIEGYNKTEIPFERRGRKIIFGAVPNVIDRTFKYGHDNELLSISKNNANAQVINRITMLGSSENIPYFYPNRTEYGNIALSAKEGNKVLTADMIRIENAPRLISRLNVGQYAILRKTEPKEGEVLPVIEIRTSFDGDSYDLFRYNAELKHESSGESMLTPWHIRIYFTVPESDVVECSSVVGYTWSQNKPTPTGVNMLGSIIPESLIFMDEAMRDDKLQQVERVGNNLSLGRLDKGRWMFQFSINIQNRDAYNRAIVTWCCLINIVIQRQPPMIPEKAKYQWEINGERYDGLGEIGVVMSSDITDDMIGDGFGWTADGRMPFQTQLMPPKYRETSGAERFYNALNDTYTDPDTGKKYIFPNPYIEGSPSEHIFTDETIKPTIEGIRNDILTETDENGNKIGQLFGAIADIAYDDNDNDAAKADSEDSDKNDSLKYEHSYFYLKLNIFSGTYGFDLLKHYSQTDAMTLQMHSGSCNGCKFKVQVEKFKDETGLEMYRNPVQTTGENGTIVPGGYADKVKTDSTQEWQQNTQTHSIWICVQKDAETFGVIMPNRTGKFMPKIGDKFNIINIDLPKEYNLAAEKRLEDKGIRYMFDNNEEKFTFNINASRIFFAENPDVLLQIDEYSKIKIEYNGRIYEQYVNEISIDCSSNEPLPNIGIVLADTLAVGQNFTESVAERAASLIANSMTLGGGVGGTAGGNKISEKLADDRYINKTKADRTPFRLSSTTGFEVGEYISGGQGGIFFQDKETGQTFLEVDKLKVRMKAIFAELEIAKESSIGGVFDITPGGGVEISFIEELTDSYRCWFKSKEEEKGAKCRFTVGDQARCQEFNIFEGTQQNATNRYYWRLVTAVNNEQSYIELSKTDCDTDSNVPMPGDTIVQLGNRTDKDRQSAIRLSTVDAFAPCITLYNGIDGYSLDGKAVIDYGVDKTKNPPEPFFNCYGRFYFGPKSGNTYVRYSPDLGVEVKAKLSIESTIGDQTFEEYIKEVVPPVTQEDIEGYVNAIIDPKIEGIQNQIDGVIETWFYNGVPTLTSYPASEWNTEALKIQHLGDLYYDNDTGTAYRFSQKADKSYFWNTITDDAITKALAAAAKAQDTADSKRKTFVSQPVPPYQEGDVWVNATYAPDYSNDILRCKTAKAAGEAFAIGDWTLASKYTDDTLAQSAINKINTFDYIKKALKDRTTIDGGLVLSSLIKLGANNEDYTTQTTYSGISGIFDTSKPGNGIAAFYGGDMIDKAEYYTFNHSTHKWEFKDGVTANTIANVRIASTLFRMDGTGYLANGTIQWDNYGAGSVADGKLWWDKDGNVQIGADVLISGGTGNPQTMAALLNAFNRFNSMFERVENEDGTWYIKAKSHLVSVGEITAFGSDGSGDSVSGGATYLRELLDVTLSDLSSGQSLVWNGTKWVNKTVSGGLDEVTLLDYLKTNGYATQSWVQGQGFLTSHQSLDHIDLVDVRDGSTLPNTYGRRLLYLFKSNYNIGLHDGGYFTSVLHFAQWKPNDRSGGCAKNLALTDNGHMYIRYGQMYATTWSAWERFALMKDLTWGNLAGKPTNFVTTDTDQLISGAKTMTSSLCINTDSRYISFNEGIRINANSVSGWATTFFGGTPGSTSEANNNGFMVAVNPQHQFFISQANSDYRTGLSILGSGVNDLCWLNNKVWHAGNDGSGSGLDADLLDGFHSGSFEGRFKTTIDATSLDNNTWYPVTMGIDNSLQTRIRIEGYTHAPGSWNTRPDKHMAIVLDYTVNGSSWGWTQYCRVVHQWLVGAGAASNVVCGLGQLTNTSTEYVFVRGGAKYDFYLSKNIIPVLRTSAYTNLSQTVQPTTTPPGLITRTDALVTDNVASATKLQTARTIWGQSFNGTGNVSGDLWGAGNINFSNNRQIGVVDRYQFGAANQSAAVGINVGSLLVSNAWADEPNVPANGIYCKGEISSSSVIQGYSYWANGINSLGNYPYITFHIPNVAYTQIFMDGSGVLHLRDGSSQSSGYKSLHALDIYAHSWLRTYGSAGWYNETYYGGWYMTDYDWIRVYNGKKVFAENTIASGTSFDRSQYGGSSWNDGIAAYNVSIHNNSSQTPLLMGYRSGVSAVGANRLFVMEFLNTGSLLRYCFGGSHKFEMYSDGDFWAAGEITALSDRRAKTDINTLPCRGALIPRTYIKDGKESIGFVAQEVQILYPELVRVGSDGLLRLNYDGITAVLQAQVNDHEARLQKLEATMNLN